MRVRELLAMLSGADPDSVVLFIDTYADSDESDEVREVYIPASAWTHERAASMRTVDMRFSIPVRLRYATEGTETLSIKARG